MPMIGVYFDQAKNYLPAVRAALLKCDPALEVVDWSEALTVPDRVDYVFVWRPPAGDLKKFTSLKAIFSAAAGVDHIVRHDPDWPVHVPLIRMGDGDTALLMGDYVLWACLTLLRGAHAWALQQQAREWKREVVTRPSGSCTVSVLGLGHLGGRVATHLRDAGFGVRGWSRRPHTMDGIACFAGPDELDHAVRDADFVVCLLPDTPSTSGILNARLFSLFAPGAGVINVGRSSHLVEADLIARLDDGHLGGAVLDVFDVEPLPAASPLWSHARITITPHVASQASIGSRMAYVVEAMRQLNRGEMPPLAYDAQRGY
ncbi:glyoxylate/hydroxypyruvate reductase A [Gluconacetobacter liquefaciens]|uniref:Glyoxylate/hydroxypyruvate reductase A n=2 Tax=Gluconacetobacter liquefaciens TaxID=89584 RepID=A0A370G7A9_GLULI|nr:glyoxylate/hydroxypyruvate reductase A [Gluconacetobacter liquefaciens]RDI39675.1 glyoxylate/hydroxypyruvate reductase A [Gluconacetobacter liquefaciens]GBR02661.1 D-isomer specific 2-hydroxyacid dehydrogenase [Gluconacetobacter liquefaciens NRIC 0522]GEB36313.1 glyoxylate/hydroxypyruvate reductase A [Gluconacetobacter liquefaciens]